MEGVFGRVWKNRVWKETMLYLYKKFHVLSLVQIDEKCKKVGIVVQCLCVEPNDHHLCAFSCFSPWLVINKKYMDAAYDALNDEFYKCKKKRAISELKKKLKKKR